MQIINILGNRYRGTAGKAVTAGTWKGRNYLRGYRKPANPKTARQVVQREYMELGSDEWHDLEREQRMAYNLHSVKKLKEITAFNSMMSSYMGKSAAGEEYEPPPYGSIVCTRSDTGVGIPAVRVYVNRQAVGRMIWDAYTNDSGMILLVSFVIEDEPYHISFEHPDFVKLTKWNVTVAEMIATHELTPNP